MQLSATVRIGIIIILAGSMMLTACQSGRIPCPENKYAKLKKSSGKRHALVYTARAEQNNETANTKPKATRAVANVGIEDWDCPKPGEKKYLPKSVKENIRKNFKKIKQQESATTTKTN